MMPHPRMPDCGNAAVEVTIATTATQDHRKSERPLDRTARYISSSSPGAFAYSSAGATCQRMPRHPTRTCRTRRAGLLVLVGSGRIKPRQIEGDLRQRLERAGDIEQPRVGVDTQRQLDRAVPHRSLRYT